MSIKLRNLRRQMLGFVDPQRRMRDFVRNYRGERSYVGMDIMSASASNKLIKDWIVSGTPASCVKIGASELKVVARHVGVLGVKGQYTKSIREEIYFHSGVYPIDDDGLYRYSTRWMSDLEQTSLLAVWFNPGERELVGNLHSKPKLTTITGLEPYYFDKPWTEALASKRVLVISPFHQSIKRNYKRRLEIWAKNAGVLPDFDLLTLPFPHSSAITGAPPQDWTDLLKTFESKLADIDYDVMIVGAGAMSIPLCTIAKRAGRVGVHLGGGTQILFGIMGSRWDNHPIISRYFNAAWTRPLDDEIPKRHSVIENGAYW